MCVCVRFLSHFLVVDSGAPRAAAVAVRAAWVSLR